MKSIFVLLTLFVVTSINTQGQNFFSIIPDFGGDGMAGMAFNVIPLEDGIKVIGLVPDSLVPGLNGGSWPILVSLSYHGEYLGTHYLVDSSYADPFRYFTRGIAFKNDSICYLYDRRDLSGDFYDAYLIELNYRSGKILRSKIVYDEITKNEDFAAIAIVVGSDTNLYLFNVTSGYGEFPILTVIDTSFNVISQSVITNFGRFNYPKYIETDDHGNITMIGMSLGEPTEVWWEAKLFKQVVDSNHESVEFILAPTEFDQSIILVDHYPIVKGQNGVWVVASQRVIETPDCQGCTNGIPYVVGVSDDFSEVLWETRMFDGDESSSNPLYWASSITEVADGYIFAGAKQGGIGNTSGILGKVGLNGDSLWLKHYIPVGWDSTRALWFDLKDIKTTPEGNIVACGRAYDRYNMIRVPWILHLDLDGCLMPGCQPTSVSDGDIDRRVDIEIFPNPARTQCNIHIQIHEPTMEYSLNILDSRGSLVRKLDVPGRDVQYILDLQDWPAGTYFMQLVDKGGSQLTKKFVVLN